MTEEGTNFYMGKYIEIICDTGIIFKGTLVNIDKYGNLELIESIAGERFKISVFRPKAIAIKHALEKRF